MKLGLSGWLTKAALATPLMPLFLIASILLGSLALSAIPREEEPQISVPMVDIHVQANGLSAADAVELVTKPLETIVKSINSVEHVYSQTSDDHVLVMARFLVGTQEDDAILRVHEKLRANYDRLPAGIPEPLVVGRGINDVAVLTLTLSPKPEQASRWSRDALSQLAVKLQAEIIKTENVGLTYIVGAHRDELRIEPDPARLAQYGLTLQQLLVKLRGANRAFQSGSLSGDGKILQVTAGETLQTPEQISQIQLTTREGRPVYVSDVADVKITPANPSHYVNSMIRNTNGEWQLAPAVTVAVAKRAGANAVVVTEAVLQRLDSLRGNLLPTDLAVEITRNYGATANEKASELIFHLALATLSIVGLIAYAIGWREGVVTLVVIPTTILLTLFSSWLLGYTINRVSLFALIFSIGILVDDAVVMVENIARHWAMQDERSRYQATIDAVAEVGNPTILATLTVVVALLPMLFVSGLMGPYMAPIPVNASIAMLISFLIAVTVVPWLMLKLAPLDSATHKHDPQGGALGRIYRRMAQPIIASKRSAFRFLLMVGLVTVVALLLFPLKAVTVKLLPFDNKSELAVVLDMPEGTTLEETSRYLQQAALLTAGMPEVQSVQLYAGTASPFNFNGLVRHYYMRQQPELGELQLNLLPRHDRTRSSHSIALDLRLRLQAVGLPQGSVLRVVEVPPGPPVLSTLLAEIYGPDAATRRAVAAEIRKIFETIPYIVDVDDTMAQPRPRQRITIKSEQLDFSGVTEDDVYDTISALTGGVLIGYSHRGEDRLPMDIRLSLPRSNLSWSERLQTTPVPANALPGNRGVVELGDIVTARTEQGAVPVFRHNGLEAEMVQAELAGAYEAPIYGMLAVQEAIDRHSWGQLPKPEIAYHGQPVDTSQPTLLWDGEWEVTYVTFRDMGAAFVVALLAIYVLVVGQFGNFRLPLVILTPVPLTFIGIMFGHWLFGAAFTATSMIGFIALAGIIVRNSILLVDFIRERRSEGSLREILLEAGAIRFRPILLTALAAMIGAAVILTDPIFQGLAISLLFGLASATLLTVLVIPAIYILLRDDGQPLRR
jgi:multidrug efflux pump subunit AcrB